MSSPRVVHLGGQHVLTLLYASYKALFNQLLSRFAGFYAIRPACS
jgi:hypothetical protein